ncbi:MAG: hypothetical protein IT514_09420 [Burkholderiales bacterium]|nr:hypothetical protein [Burkholderiales bacterium]
MKRTIPQTPAEYDQARVIERPDGFYWQEKSSGREFGPFSTLLEATQDMQGFDEDGSGPGESLQEAENEIGMADWIDPDTGEPAEEYRPRIDDN